MRFGTLTINRDSERKPVALSSRKNVEKKYDYYGASGKIDKIDNYLFDEKLLLIGEDGANLVTRSKPIAFFAEGQYWVNNHAHCIDATDKRYLNYLCYFINAINLEPYVTGSAQPKMNQENMNNILISLPPFKEQLQILNQIDLFYEAISSLENEQQGLVDLIGMTKSKILDFAIRGKLVPQDPDDEPASVLLERIRTQKEELIKQGKIKRDKKESVIFKGEDNSYYEKIGKATVCIDSEIPFELPNGWIWCRGYSCFSGMETKRPDGDFFKYIDIDSIDNKAHKVKQPKYLATKDAPSRASRAVQAGSVLFSFVRPYLENIAYINEENKDCIASTGFYVCNSNGMLYPPFMYFLMTSEYVVQGLNQFMKGDNSPSIGKDNIENWLYPIPPINEQKVICQNLEHLFNLISTVKKSLS